MPTPSGGIAAYIADYIASNIGGSLVGTAGGFFSGASIDMNFQTGNYFGATPAGLTTVRASTANANDASGNWTSFANNIPRITNLGLLVEEARTNGIINNSMQGAVAGSPGTLPTGWTDAMPTNGISRQVVSLGAINGIDTMVLRYTGTAVATVAISLLHQPQITQAAVNGQTWDYSAFLSIVINSGVAPLLVGLEIDELDVGGSFLAGTQTTVAANSTLTRFDTTRVNNNVSTAFERGFTRISLSIGQTYDFTLTIGWPQLELGASVTSPIRTTAAAVTRAADVITLTSPPAFGAAYSTFFKGTPQPPAAYGTAQNFLQLDAGTDVQRLVERRNAATAALLTTLVGGTGAGFAPVATLTQNVSFKVASAITANDQASVINGGTPGTAAAAVLPTTPTSVRFGSNSAGTESWNGFVERVALWPSTRIPNSQLQAITT